MCRGTELLALPMSALQEPLQGRDGERPPWLNARCASKKLPMGWALVQNLTQSSSKWGKPGHAAERGGVSLPSALPAFVLV